MSSGVELLILFPFLLPAAGTASASGSSALGGAIMAPTLTSSGVAASSGGAAASGVGAAGVGAGALVVAGVAGIALLAAYGMGRGYDAALCAHASRIEAQAAGLRNAQEKSALAAAIAARKSQNAAQKAAGDARLLFLQSGVKRLNERMSGWNDVPPNLPGGLAALGSELEKPLPDLESLMLVYEALSVAVSREGERQRALLAKAPRTSRSDETLGAAITEEIKSLRNELVSAPAALLEAQTRVALESLLDQVEHLAASQPRMALQGLALLRPRLARELRLGAEAAARQQLEEEKQLARQRGREARVRDLSAHIAARCQSVSEALAAPELQIGAHTGAQIETLRVGATRHIEALAGLLRCELPEDLAFLEHLGEQADALFASTQKFLGEVAAQAFLQDQLREVFTQLGYRVSLAESGAPATGAVLAALDRDSGVEMRLDGQGHLVSELVAFSPEHRELQAGAQEKVCALVDEVIDALSERGLGVREKKRRHFKPGERALRVVARPEKVPENQNLTQSAPRKRARPL